MAAVEPIRIDKMYMSKREVADLLRCSTRTVERLVSTCFKGFPPPVKIFRGKVLFRSAYVRDWLSRREREGGFTQERAVT